MATSITCSGVQLANHLAVGSRLINGTVVPTEQSGTFQVSLQVSLLADSGIQLEVTYRNLEALPIDILNIPVGLAAGETAVITEDSAGIFEVVDRLLRLRPGALLMGDGSVALMGRCPSCWERIFKEISIGCPMFGSKF